MTVPPLVQFHAAGSFFRPSGILLLSPRCDSHCISVVELFVIQPGQRTRENCCSLRVRITLLFGGCLPLSHLLCTSSGSPQCGAYHDDSSCSSDFQFFQCSKMLFASSSEMPAKETADGCFWKVVTNPLDLSKPRQRMAETGFCGLAEGLQHRLLFHCLPELRTPSPGCVRSPRAEVLLGLCV